MSKTNSSASKSVLLICVNFNHDPDFTELVEEGVGLVEAGGYTITETITMNKNSVDPKFFIGSGKADEIKTMCQALEVKHVIINHNLSSVQERNLELELNLPVIDRTRLILDIFASRVKSNEGVLQVELALQTHQLSRLVKRWTHLERQKGGIGLRGGPGEKQIELDKRQIRDKIKVLKQRLSLAVKQRSTQRKARFKNSVFSVSIVGYTNAGKSTLFNALTKANVYVKDQLFATLQTTSRKLFIDEHQSIVISDTVGFIRNLPHTLVASFKATLEETIHADLLLHVVDVSQVLMDRQIEDVNKVLEEINANDIPQLIIYNKIDLTPDPSAKIEYNHQNEPVAVYVSATDNLGLDLINQAISQKMDWQRANKNKTQDLVYEPWKHK